MGVRFNKSYQSECTTLETQKSVRVQTCVVTDPYCASVYADRGHTSWPRAAQPQRFAVPVTTMQWR